jgi:hypothetical protein
MKFIPKIMTNKYVLTTLFVIPSVIITGNAGINNANCHNKHEPDTNKHISPIKNSITYGLSGIILSPLINTALIFIALDYLGNFTISFDFKKDDN